MFPSLCWWMAIFHFGCGPVPATVVSGDLHVLSIAAASVLAKQARDHLIQRLAATFPGYGLERHAGYGTRVHREALLALGPTALHRRSFLKRLGV